MEAYERKNKPLLVDNIFSVRSWVGLAEIAVFKELIVLSALF